MSNFPYRQDERSNLWGATAGGALAGGVGYGLFRGRAGFLPALAIGNRDVAAEVSTELSSLGRFNVGRTNKAAAEISDNILQNLVASSAPITMKNEIATSAYEAILAGGRADQKEAYAEFTKILNEPSVFNANKIAQQSIATFHGDPSRYSDNILGLGQGGFYGRFGGQIGGMSAAIGHADTAGGQFAGSSIARQLTPLEGLSPAIQKEAQGIKARLTTAARSAGGLISWNEGVRNVEDIIEGKVITTPMLQASVGHEAINIPLGSTGLTYGGKGLGTKYITRQAHGATGLRNFTEEYVSQLEIAMGRQQTTTGLKNAVIDVNKQIIENMNVRDSAARSMAIWNMPEAVLPSGGRAKARLHAAEAVFADGRMTDAIRDKIIDEGRLWPVGGSGPVSKGTFATRNIVEELFGPMGRLAGIEQEPLKFIRGDFGATAGAKAAAPGFGGTFGQFYNRLDRKIQGPGYQSFLGGGASASSAEAYTAPQLMTFYAKKEALESGALSEVMHAEEMVISGRAAPMVEYERTVQKKIALRDQFKVNEQILTGLEGKRIGELVELPGIGRGEYLGIEASSGKKLWTEGAGGAEARVTHVQLSADNTAIAYMRETHQLPKKGWMKFFSEDVKSAAQQADDARMRKVLTAAGAGQEIGGKQIEAIVSGKLTERHRWALMTQQIEAMSIFAGDRIDKNKMSMRTRQLAKEFMSDPAQMLNVNSLRNENIAAAEFQIQKNMVAMSKKFGFGEEEMKLTFGLMDSGAAERLGISNVVAKSSGVVGLSKLKLGGLSFEGGAGGLASMEQSGFRALAMKGEEGSRFAAELSTRIKGTGMLKPMNKLEESILRPQNLIEKITGSDVDSRLLGQLQKEDLLQETGRYVKFGQPIKAFGGASQMYIPGLGEAEGLMAYTVTDRGSRVASPVTKGMQELRNAFGQAAAPEKIEAIAQRLRKDIVQQTELQGTTKGKIIGSQFLTGTRQTAKETIRGGGAIRIGKKAGARMYDDLIERSTTEAERTFLKGQKKKLIEENMTLAAGMWRHPTSSMESFQFVSMKVDPSLADEMISVPRQVSELVMDGKRSMIDISAMAGQSGDFDFDRFAVAAISDEKTAAAVTQRIGSGAQAKEYGDFLFEHYAMKDLMDKSKGNIDSLAQGSYRQRIKQGAKNLTTANIATPKVNTALQKLKLGLQYAAPEKYKSMAQTFYHLEQAAIGGKHGAQQGELYQNIAHAVNQNDSKTMKNVVQQLFGAEDKVVQGELLGKKRSWAFNSQTMADDLLKYSSVVSEDVDIAIRSAQVAKGNINMGDKEFNELATKMFQQRRTGSVDVAQSLMNAQAYGMPKFTEKTTRMLRQAESKSRGLMGAMKKAKAPIAIGAAVAAGLMLAAPSVSGTLAAPRDGVAGGRNMRPDDLGVPTGVGMTPPPARIMRSPQVYDMSRTQLSSRANIRMSVPDANRSAGRFQQQTRALANGAATRINMRDDRSALSPHRLANKIHERL